MNFPERTPLTWLPAFVNLMVAFQRPMAPGMAVRLNEHSLANENTVRCVEFKSGTKSISAAMESCGCRMFGADAKCPWNGRSCLESMLPFTPFEEAVTV